MRNVLALMWVTLLETVRAKTLYGVLFFLVIIILVSSVVGSVSIGNKIIVIKDFGLFSISFLIVMYTVINGAAFLHKELMRKTIYTIMARPVLISEFIAGKFLGLVSISFLMLCTMSFLLSLYTYFFEGVVDFSLLYAYFLIGLELLVVAALTIFFSSLVVTPLLNGLFVFFVFLAGRSSHYIASLGELTDSTIPTIIYWIVPHLDKIALYDKIVYGDVPSFSYLIQSIIYCTGYSLVLVTLSCLVFSRREFH